MRKREQREMPEMNTSSLPDLIFTILFFFMIVTSMREVTLKVKTDIPAGTELEKMEKKSCISHIYIGPPTDQLRAQFGSSTRMQINDRFAEPKELIDFVKQERATMYDESEQVMSLKIDKSSKMGIVTEVKEQLRKAYALKISYTAVKRQ